MISEKEQLEKRIERMRKKAEGINKHEEMLAAAHSLRVEHDREAELQRNRDEQRDQLMAAEEKLQRMHTQLREVRNNSVSGGVQGVSWVGQCGNEKGSGYWLSHSPPSLYPPRSTPPP